MNFLKGQVKKIIPLAILGVFLLFCFSLFSSINTEATSKTIESGVVSNITDFGSSNILQNPLSNTFTNLSLDLVSEPLKMVGGVIDGMIMFVLKVLLWITGFVYWIINMVITLLVKGASYFLAFILVSDDLDLVTGEGFFDGILSTWVVFVNIGNLFIISTFVGVGLAYILDLKSIPKSSININNFIIQIILIAVLTNFSLAITATLFNTARGITNIIIDTTYEEEPSEANRIGGTVNIISKPMDCLTAVTLAEKDGEEGDGGGDEKCKIDPGRDLEGLTFGYFEKLTDEEGTQDIIAFFIKQLGAMMTGLFLLWIIGKTLLIAFKKLLFTWVLLATSPLALVGWNSPIPQFKNMTENWIKKFSSTILFYPHFIFWLVILSIILKSIYDLDIESVSNDSNFAEQIFNLEGLMQDVVVGLVEGLLPVWVLLVGLNMLGEFIEETDKNLETGVGKVMEKVGKPTASIARSGASLGSKLGGKTITGIPKVIGGIPKVIGKQLKRKMPKNRLQSRGRYWDLFNKKNRTAEESTEMANLKANLGGGPVKRLNKKEEEGWNDIKKQSASKQSASIKREDRYQYKKSKYENLSERKRYWDLGFKKDKTDEDLLEMQRIKNRLGGSVINLSDDEKSELKDLENYERSRKRKEKWRSFFSGVSNNISGGVSGIGNHLENGSIVPAVLSAPDWIPGLSKIAEENFGWEKTSKAVGGSILADVQSSLSSVRANKGPIAKTFNKLQKNWMDTATIDDGLAGFSESIEYIDKDSLKELINQEVAKQKSNLYPNKKGDLGPNTIEAFRSIIRGVSSKKDIKSSDLIDKIAKMRTGKDSQVIETLEQEIKRIVSNPTLMSKLEERESNMLRELIGNRITSDEVYQATRNNSPYLLDKKTMNEVFRAALKTDGGITRIFNNEATVAFLNKELNSRNNSQVDRDILSAFAEIQKEGSKVNREGERKSESQNKEQLEAMNNLAEQMKDLNQNLKKKSRVKPKKNK